MLALQRETNKLLSERRKYLQITKPTQTINESEVRDKSTSPKLNNYEGWNFNSGNYLFTTDTK